MSIALPIIAVLIKDYDMKMDVFKTKNVFYSNIIHLLAEVNNVFTRIANISYITSLEAGLGQQCNRVHLADPEIKGNIDI